MKLPLEITVYGDMEYRGPCQTEASEQIAFFTWLRAQYPKTHGAIAVHIRNEGARSHAQARWQAAEGMTKGAADIIIPGRPAFVCEMKRRDSSKSKLDDAQIAYLTAAQKAGAFVCVALGFEAARQAVKDWEAAQ